MQHVSGRCRQCTEKNVQCSLATPVVKRGKLDADLERNSSVVRLYSERIPQESLDYIDYISRCGKRTDHRRDEKSTTHLP